MIEAEAIGWWNTGFPLVLLSVLAALLPWWIVPGKTRAHSTVAAGVLTSAVMLFAIGAGLMALIYAARGAEIQAAFDVAPDGVVVFFLRLSAFTAMAWGPILVLVWLAMAQRVEKLKGEDLMDGSR